MENGKPEYKLETIRVDMKTRICIMAALMVGVDNMTDTEIVNRAISLDTIADAAIARLKRSNPIVRRDDESRKLSSAR